MGGGSGSLERQSSPLLAPVVKHRSRASGGDQHAVVVALGCKRPVGAFEHVAHSGGRASAGSQRRGAVRTAFAAFSTVCWA
jgi:hypothetical protein